MNSCNYTKLAAADEDIEKSADVVVYPTTKPFPVKKTRSCLKTCLWVTLILLAILLTMMIAAGIGAYMWIGGQVRKWTVTTPLDDLPVVDVPDAELQVFKDEAELFFDTIQAEDLAPPNDFVVPARILNGFAASSDYLHGNAYAEIDTNQVTMTLSLPMDGLPGGCGRFLVGTETLSWDPATSVLHAKMVSVDNVDEYNDEDTPSKTFYDVQFHLQLTDDKWNLMILSGQFLDWTVPQDFIDEHNNLLDDVYNCDDDDDDCKVMRKLLQALEDITFEKDQVVIHPKNNELNGGGPVARALVERWSSNYKRGWKLQLASHFAF